VICANRTSRVQRSSLGALRARSVAVRSPTTRTWSSRWVRARYPLERHFKKIPSTLYFFLSPLTGAHSELLPRTTPNIWDVLIALFGGLAGMGGRYITESRLHQKMLAFVRPGTSFHDLDEFANEQIREEGFENLDFLGNVGRSICQHRDDRLYIEAGNHRRLGEVGCFTFEPHISQHGSCWGLKHENIYYFDDSGVVTEL